MDTVPRILLDLRPLQMAYAGHGIGRYTRELTRTLLALTQKNEIEWGIHLEALVLQGMPFEFADGLKVGAVCPSWKRIWLWDQLVLGPRLALGEWDLLHNFVTLGPLAQCSLPLLGAGRSIATVHDLHLFAAKAEPVLQAYKRTWRIRLQEKALPRAKAVIVDAAPVDQEVAERFHPKGRLYRVTPGLDHGGLWPKQGERNGPGGPYVLALGDTQNKRIAFAAEVVSKLVDQGIPLELCLVGQKQQVLEQLGPWRNKPFIRIESNASDADLLQLYAGALALVFPSSQEGFGFPILEAQAQGCPALVVDKEPMRSWVGVAEHQLPENDPNPWVRALALLLQDPGWRTHSGDRGRLHVQGFTWQKTAEQVMHIWWQVLKKP